MFRKCLGAVSTLALAAGLFAQPASAAPVFPGCPIPAVSQTAHSFYVDPVHGSMSGDGSAAHPWHTLAEVVNAGLFTTSPYLGPNHTFPGMRAANASINPGDTVYLLSGNHGAVKFQGWFGTGTTSQGYNNSDFITIAAASGQTPVLQSLVFDGGEKWIFRGLTIQSINTTGKYIGAGSPGPDFDLVKLEGPHDNIIIDNNNILSTPDISHWQMIDWLDKRASGVVDIKGNCISITNNKIHNIGFAIQSATDNNVLITGNNINYFSDDGIDYGANNLIISNNTVTNSIEDGDGFHRDAMQGQPLTQTTTTSNVTITNNLVIRVQDPNITFPGYLQGIDAFDGLWQNLIVTGNTVITDATQGISFYGVNNLTLTNNTLLADNGRVMPCPGLTFANCAVTTQIYDATVRPNIVVMHSKSGIPSSNINFGDNVTSGLGVDISTTNFNLHNNLCLPKAGYCNMSIPVAGVKTWDCKPGTYGNKNVIPGFTAQQFYVGFDPTTYQYNLTLKLANPAL